MLVPAPRLTLLSAGALAAVLSLSACSGSDPATAAPKPVASLPAPVQSLVQGTDVGEFFVTPKAGTPKTAVNGAVAKLRTLPGVQSAELNKDGVVDVTFRGSITKSQREAAVKQLAALGDVQEGI